MKVGVGKRYVRRDGSVTPPLVQSPTDSKLVQDTETEFVFNIEENGSVFVSSHDDADLMEEYIEPGGTTDALASADKGAIDKASLKDRNASIDNTLSERGTKYGEFHNHAALSQDLSEVMSNGESWPKLSAAQREALQMIQHKIARILNGDPLYLDSWVDIVGYGELGKRETERLGGK